MDLSNITIDEEEVKLAINVIGKYVDQEMKETQKRINNKIFILENTSYLYFLSGLAFQLSYLISIIEHKEVSKKMMQQLAEEEVENGATIN